ncbi:unnamed protein product [Rotaria sp. Silwood1]|nr:unnamed protein product [Rotaria sp. Silwood1]CAF3441849.1 unnamed protein product [Rotaria sp. Silwood1]CAF4961351.1 unnamed protein product [Rotaria sp. Silwood1]
MPPHYTNNASSIACEFQAPSPHLDTLTGEKHYTSEDPFKLTPKQYEEWIFIRKIPNMSMKSDYIEPRSQKFHFFLHGIHHVAPTDLWHVFSPIHELGTQAPIAWFIFWLVRMPDSSALISGMLINYIRYDSIHYIIHAYTPIQIFRILFIGNCLRKCSIHHRRHHFSNPRKHFTISFVSSLVD